MLDGATEWLTVRPEAETLSKDVPHRPHVGETGAANRFSAIERHGASECEGGLFFAALLHARPL